MFSLARLNTKSRLLTSSALVGGVILIGLQASPVQATACMNNMDFPFATVCIGGVNNNVDLLYPTPDNMLYKGGNFALGLSGTVVSGGVTKIDVKSAASFANAFANNVNLSNAGDVLAVATVDGDITIHVTGNSNLSSTAVGTTAIGGGAGGIGNVTIETKDQTIISGAGAGISAGASGSGAVTIKANNTGGITSTGDAGIQAFSNTGSIDISGTATVKSGPMAVGVRGTSQGGGNVEIVYDGAISGGSTGILAETPFGMGTVTVTANNTVSAATGDGIFTTTDKGATSIATANTVTGAISGIIASSASGHISVAAAKSVTGTMGDGIVGVTNGPGSVTIGTAVGATVVGGGDGIRANTDDGIIAVTVNADVTGGASGIETLNSTGTTVIVNNGGMI